MIDPFQPIESSRLTLRCARLTDAPALSLLMVEEVSRWMASWPVPFTRAMAEERITKARAAAAAGDALPFAVERRADGVLLGWLGVDRVTSDRGAVAYWYGTAFHGQGYAKEALARGLEAAFAQLGVKVMEACLQHANLASIKVLTACGMKQAREGTVYAQTRQREETVLFYVFFFFIKLKYIIFFFLLKKNPPRWLPCYPVNKVW